MQYNGLKFSFSLRPKTPPSPHSTPKFPSIEIQKQMQATHRKQAVKLEQEPLVIVSASSANKKERVRPESRGKRMLQKYAHLTLLSNRQRQQKDSRSVRSAQSSKSYKNYRSKTETAPSLIKSIQNRHNSMSSSSFSPRNNNIKAKNKTKIQTKDAFQDQLKIKRRLFQQKSVEKLQNMQQFLGIKLKDSPQKQQTLHQWKRKNLIDKGQSFKAICYKPRPVLKIGSRILNNRKLQEMSRPFEMQDFSQF